MAITTAIIYVLMVLGILAAIFALECKRLIFSVISLIVLNLFIWILLLLLEAYLLAWIQLIVYGGGLTALFVVVVALTERQRDETFDWKRSIIAFSAIAIIVGFSIWAVVIFGNSAAVLPSQFTSIDIIASLKALWSERLVDLILQAIVFFVTSIGIGVLFLQYKKKTKEAVKA